MFPVKGVAMSKRVRNHSAKKPPARGRQPGSRLAERDLQAVADELLSFHHLFDAVFQRREQREWDALALCIQKKVLC